jgi:translocation and assembly module TamA
VGARDADDEVIGGKYVATASLEFERQFRPDFAWAAFVDAGDAWSDGSPDIVVGAGFGIRWISPVGPVRVDLAHGFDDDSVVTLHVSAGPDL